MSLTANEQAFLLKLQQSSTEQIASSSVLLSFDEKIDHIKRNVKEAKNQLLQVQDHLNALEKASKGLKETYLKHQHSFIELNGLINWFDILDELIVILRSGTPVLIAVDRVFDKMYTEVDQCHLYLLQHPEYKLSKEYLQTTRIVITKALTMYSFAFLEYLSTVPYEVISLETAQSNFKFATPELLRYIKPLSEKEEDVEFRQILEDCVEGFLGHRNTSLKPLFTNFTLDSTSSMKCVFGYTKQIKQFLLLESQLLESLFTKNYINYNQMYSTLIQIATKQVVEFLQKMDEESLLEIRLSINTEFIASELDSKAKLVLLDGCTDLLTQLNKL